MCIKYIKVGNTRLKGMGNEIRLFLVFVKIESVGRWEM